MAATKYLDLAGLTQYDSKIKALINNQDVKKIAINTLPVVFNAGEANEKTYAAGNVLLVWIGWNGATTDEAKTAYLNNEVNAAYKVPMGAAALEALIGSYNPATAPKSPLKDRGWDENGTAEEKAAHEHAHSNIVGYIGAVRDEAAANLDYELGQLDLAEAPIAEVNDNVVTIHGIKQEDGAVAVGDTITFTKSV